MPRGALPVLEEGCSRPNLPVFVRRFGQGNTSCVVASIEMLAGTADREVSWLSLEGAWAAPDSSDN